MRILIAAAAFKETFASTEVCDALAEGARAAAPGAEVVPLPLADGGAGTLDILVRARRGGKVACYVRGPRTAQVRSSLGLLEGGREAVIETAQAAGLARLPSRDRNPELTSTYGVGEMVVEALERGVERVSLALGDSATVDGGLGMAEAVGYRLLDAKGLEVGYTGGVMGQIARIEAGGAHGRLRQTRFTALCDVRSPLLGPQGAAAVFGPQKGATPEQVDRLEEGLAHLADLAERDLGADPSLRCVPGAGAAGGLGWGAAVWLGATLESGAERVLEAVGFGAALERADLVMTAEGSWEAQSGMGKVTGEVASRAKKAGVPVLVVCAAGEGENVWSAERIGKGGVLLGRPDLVEMARRAVASKA